MSSCAFARSALILPPLSFLTNFPAPMILIVVILLLLCVLVATDTDAGSQT